MGRSYLGYRDNILTSGDIVNNIDHAGHEVRACSYGQKISRLPRKHFDKFTSEILPCYEII